MEVCDLSERSCRLLKPTEVANRLRVSIRQLWRLRSQGAIPSPVRVGQRCTRWREVDLDDYLMQL